MSAADTVKISIGQYKKLMKAEFSVPIEDHTPIFITGIPGLGKTQTTHQGCEELNTNCWAVRPVQHESVEFTGIPQLFVDNGIDMAKFVALDELLPVDPSWSGYIFLDEITQLDVNGQKIVASLVDKSGVAGRRLPPNARFILAGNRTSDRAGASAMLSIIKRRCQQYELVFDVQDWIDWATDDGVSEVVIGFARFKGGAFVPEFDPSQSAYPLPSTWKGVDTAIKYMGDMADLSIRSRIGAGMGAEFCAFHKHFDILKGLVPRIIDGRQLNYDEIDKVSVQHALIGAVVEYIKTNNITDDQFSNAMSYMSSGPIQASMLGLFHCRMMAVCGKRLLASDGFRKWASENAEAIKAFRKAG